MIHYDVTQLSVEDIEIRLNQIDRKKCRFGADVDELDKETETLLNECKNRGYKIENKIYKSIK